MDYTLIAVSDEELQWLGIFNDVCLTRKMVGRFPDSFHGRVKVDGERLLQAYEALLVAHDVAFKCCATHTRYVE